MRFRHSLILLAVLSCGVKQPVNITPEDNTGSVLVTSEPAGASIFLDGLFENKSTPDTLKNISPGTHIISVIKEGYKSTNDSISILVEKDSLKQVHFLLDEIIHLGSLYLETDPAGAEIFVDGQSTAKFTPDTIRLEPGNYAISARKNGFKVLEQEMEIMEDSLLIGSVALEIEQRVLFESFGNVSCVPCVKSAENLERFRGEHLEPGYALMEYYANWPAPNDPFYLEAPQDVDERLNFYAKDDPSYYSLPTLTMRGKTQVDAQNYDEIVSTYTQQFTGQQTQLAISISKQKPDSVLNLQIELYDYDNILQNTNLRLFVAVVEDEIHKSSPPGSNGLKDFNFVFRGFISSRTGDAISGLEKVYSFNWPSWNYTNTYIVVFIQDIITKEVIQSSIN